MYFVRADGNAKIGAGHLMRCLTIAEAMVKLSVAESDILFVCADESSAILVREHGFGAEVLGTDYQRLSEELAAWESILKVQEQEDHVILVDSYYVTDSYLEALRRYGKVFLLDDMQQHAYPVDGVINYNAFADERIYGDLYRNTVASYYVGSSYVPVRPQFLDCRYAVREEVRDILITTGGGDQDNIAGAVLEKIYREDINYHLVIGAFSPNREKIESWASGRRGVNLCVDVKNMAELMQKCDLAITAGGTTIYELAAIGVPFICFSYAENQEALTEYIGKNEVAGYAGAYHKDAGRVLRRIEELVQEFMVSKEKRRTCSQIETQMIDGLGAKRLASVLKQEGVSARG